MLACLLQALGGCDRRCGRGCDRLDGRLAAIGGFPAAGDSESAFSDGCLAALGLVSVCCSGVRPSCLNILPGETTFVVVLGSVSSSRWTKDNFVTGRFFASV